MGLRKTCDFCGDTDANGYYQIFIQNIEKYETPSDYCMCSECVIRLLSSVKNVEDVKMEIPETKPKTNDRLFEGLPLREFLRTSYYLDDKETVFIFRTATGEPIIDLHAWMGQPIESVSPKNDKSEVYVTLFDNMTFADE